uniref:Tyrosine-protein phosphatase domain-containing protein n=1 Tax=Sus scrofa TaxID=9823 RepID=A0A4X1SDK2_PIG
THRPIPVHSFRQNYEAKRAHTHQAFFQEFEELKEVGKEQPRLEAEHPANTAKNRYPHVLPYDHSRVRLTLLDGEPHSDYINASFIPVGAFIATQGPLKKTLEDFWRLVWEQQVRVIVMLTVGMENGRVSAPLWLASRWQALPAGLAMVGTERSGQEVVGPQLTRWTSSPLPLPFLTVSTLPAPGPQGHRC